MADRRKLKDRAAEHLARGRFARAAEALAEVVEADPRDIPARQKLGDALRKAGQPGQARRVYEEVAERYARDGQLVKAIAICKLVLEIDAGHQATQQLLAELYARRQGAPGRAAPVAQEEERGVELPLTPISTPTPTPTPTPTATPTATATPTPTPTVAAASTAEESLALGSAATPFEAILEVARAGAGEGEEVLILADEPLPEAAPAGPSGAVPPALPRTPIFSDLGEAAFVELAGQVVLRRLAAGEAVVRQGEGGTSFFVVATGAVRVERAGPDGAVQPLARLGEGAFFGEMAILSGEPRAATVVAELPTELLEVRAEVLLGLARKHPQIVQSLARFYRRRLLANAMVQSPLFQPFTRPERVELMGRFRTRPVEPGEAVVAEGSPSDGLYVVLSGALDVWKARADGQVRAGLLREGDLFGEMSCLSKGPARASVVAARRGVLLRLPRAAFDELVLTHPQILELVAELSDERQRTLAAIAGGQASFAEDGLLLV
jgi:CRP-like cAMP-binding protein